jgi:predicted DNA-binding transcriptional regulator AlpA
MSTASLAPAADLSALAALPDDAAVDVRPVAQMLACSIRHVWRMADAGAMPAPLSLGRLRRWRVGTLREWIRSGCRPVKEGRR